MDASRLHLVVSAIAPIVGVSIGDEDDRSSWTVFFADDATESQKKAALTALATFAPTPFKADLYAERDRRLALGFDYEFNDERGVHRINTTPADMIGWDEVTKLAQALINLDQPDAHITIATGSGIAEVTAMEWQAVLLAAGTFRQQVWGASFMLEAVDPIPDDFAEDGYWNI